MVKLSIKIVDDSTGQPDMEPVKDLEFCASLENQDEIIAGYGGNPYEALRDLIDEMEYHHEYFRPD